MKYKKTYYQISQQVDDCVFLCSNFNNNSHILLSKDAYTYYIDNNEDIGLVKLKQYYPSVFERLVSNGFIIEADVNEIRQLYNKRKETIEDTQMYHMVINPTLDCNLSCWYCYERKVARSSMDTKITNAIIKNIIFHFRKKPYSLLKLSFFGGEPFLRPLIIKQIVEGADNFCKNNNVRLLLDFTTNGTLCSPSIISFLRNYACSFQITLDGDKEQYNKIKYTQSRNFDTFSTTIKNIHKIEHEIRNSYVAVRINFDKNTLENFDGILSELIDLDRCKTKIILKRIWQVGSEEISKSLVSQCLAKLFENHFVVDFYSQGGICFADRRNQILFNYDGNIFKCTTISNFGTNNALGQLDLETGEIHWDPSKTKYLFQDTIAETCRNCRMLPSCGGFCQKKVASKENLICFLTASDLTMEEFALIQFKISLVRESYVNSK